MKKLQIIKEFQSLIPPLTREEFDLLEQNILKEGIRDPIIVYGDTIVDGHNRYEIAQKHGLEFNIINKEFNSMDEAEIWIGENQLGRRNIFDFGRYEAVVKIVEKAKFALIASNPEIKPYNTRNMIAKKLGWSDRKVSMAKFIKQNAELETLKKLRIGKFSINKVYEKLKKAQKVSNNEEGLSNVDKIKSISSTNSTKKLFKYELMVPSELNNTTIEHMKNDKISNKEEAAINLWSEGVYYRYYIKE